MSFLRTSFWGGLSTGITMLAGLVSTKYVAMIIGPSGMAYVGQFSNITGLVLLLATGACSSGVIKYISEYAENDERRKVVANSLLLASGCVIIMSLVLMFFSAQLAENAFKDKSYYNVFLIYGVLLVFPTFNSLASSILNGLMRIRLMSIINIVMTCINLLSILIAARYFGIRGVLLANVVSASIAATIYFFYIRKTGLMPSVKITGAYDKVFMKLLLGFSAMNLVSGIVAPALQLFVRTKLLSNFDAKTAGLWQANTRLSDYYLNFIYTVIGIYYLPKLSAVKEPEALKKELRLGFMRIIPAVIVITLMIWFCRNLIVDILLTKQFEGMLVLLKWQLIGDVIKIAAWLLGFVMVAKAMKKMFIITEIVFSISNVLLNYLLINKFGLIGTVYAFTLNYTLYLITLSVALRRYIF